MQHARAIATSAHTLAEVEACQRTYDRIAPIYDLLDGIYEQAWKRRLRRALFRHAHGRLLDVGVGTGCNMPFYPARAVVTGIDTSAGMLIKARQRARALGLAIDLRACNLLALEFADASFDTVAVTFVLLCLPDALQVPALSELRRVCRPDGRVLVLDYRRSEKAGVRLWMRCLAPWLKWAFAARFDPAIEHHIEAAGLRIVERGTFMGDGVMMLVLAPT